MKKAVFHSSLLLMLLALGCDKEQPEDLRSPQTFEPEYSNPDDFKGKAPLPTQDREWINYIIPEGEHYSLNSGLRLFNQDSLGFYFVFDSTAIYQSVDPVNQMDWNKLMGFSDCQSHHHQNSIRLVWRWTPSLGLEIGKYVYSSGVLEHQSMGTIALGDTNFASLSAEPGFYKLRLNGQFDEHLRKCNKRSASYMLFPYFGGDDVAPHDVNIHISYR